MMDSRGLGRIHHKIYVAKGFTLIHENDYEETLSLVDFKDLINIIMISDCDNCILKFVI